MPLRFASFSIIKNESAILNPFLDQLETFFDVSFILDHGSVDGSAGLVRARGGKRFHLFDLNTAGYPQSEVATFFAHRIFSEVDPDFVFFLDCDEFLPFADRRALESWLQKHRKYDVLRLPWLNVCPANLGGDNIFASSFLRGPDQLEYTKIILCKTVRDSAPNFVVSQGNHQLITGGLAVKTWNVDDAYLIHIPVQSRVQLALKAVNGNRALKDDKKNLAKGLGRHWIVMATELATYAHSEQAIHHFALTYNQHGQLRAPTSQFDADQPPIYPKLEFEFPYIKSAYEEKSINLAAQIADFSKQGPYSRVDSAQIVVTNSAGEVVFGSLPKSSQDSLASARSPLIPDDSFAVHYERLIAPLFHLPTKLLASPWMGHIPFLFVLFKLLEPRTYVELGVHAGCSFVAACTAAQTFALSTHLCGIDTWQGDPHSGFFDGEEMYRYLKTYTEGNFANTRLIKATFSEARLSFKNQSIDILHIDGFHSFEAVKDDFTTWFPTLSTQGVVLFHDICVYEKQFGVHRLWAELKEKFSTLEFYHASGLGVLFLNGSDPRIAPLLKMAQDPKAWQLYQNLVADIAAVLGERAGYYAGVTSLEWSPSQPSPVYLLQMLYRSRILRTFGPLSKSWRFAKKILQDHPIVNQ